MIAATGPNLPVPTRRASRVERAARADAETGSGERRASAPVPASRRDHPVTPGAPARPAGPAAGSTLIALQAYPRLRGLRADETERRRYRDAYARAGEGVRPYTAPKLERTA